MALDKDLVSRITNDLQPLGPVTSKFMFGGAGLFYDGKMFAMVSSDNRFWLKVDDSNRAEYEKLGMQQFNKSPKNKGMPYFEVPSEVFENTDKLLAWAKESIDIINT